MTTAALAIASVLWAGLRRLVRLLGKWTIAELVKRGSERLALYLEMRVDVFRRRLKRITSRVHQEWRPKFLKGRIRRWLAAAKWLNEQAARLGKLSGEAIEPHIRDLPEESPWENERAWRRMVKA